MNTETLSIDMGRVQQPVRFSHGHGTFAVCPYCRRVCVLDQSETRCEHFYGRSILDGESGQPVTTEFRNGDDSAPLSVALGECRITPGASREAVALGVDPKILLSRHAGGDWGDLSPEDWALNDRAARDGDRVLSSYRFTDDVRFWVITEADRSYTTVMLPDEY